MKGVEAVARAICANTDFQYTVPGYPVTELGDQTNAEMVINEKTALEYALGDSLSGKRAAVIVKHVGVNACADPLLQATAQGLKAGVILVVGDDPDATGSQTAQDSRYYGELAEIPVVEPDLSSCYTGVESALDASERFSRVSLLRLTPHILGAEVTCKPIPRGKNMGKLAKEGLTMHGRVTAAGESYRRMYAWSNSSMLNHWKGGSLGVGDAPGSSRVVTVNPVPAPASQFMEINEFGRHFVQDHCKIQPPKKSEPPESWKDRGFCRTFCSECPYHTLFRILKEKGLHLLCDAGCSVLFMNPPYGMGIASYGMGSSIAVAAKSTKVALIGDYALLHSGINALIDVYEKRRPVLCIVMNNHTAAMTGGQDVLDPIPYIQWANPVICSAGDAAFLKELIVEPHEPVTVVVDAKCPKGAHHETVEC